MHEIDRGLTFQARLAEESENQESCWWMSYCDTTKPKGSQFIGVNIIKAKGLPHATKRAWDLGINPGGEIMSYEIEASAIAPEHLDKLLSKSDLIAAGYIDA